MTLKIPSNPLADNNSRRNRERRKQKRCPSKKSDDSSFICELYVRLAVVRKMARLIRKSLAAFVDQNPETTVAGELKQLRGHLRTTFIILRQMQRQQPTCAISVWQTCRGAAAALLDDRDGLHRWWPRLGRRGRENRQSAGECQSSYAAIIGAELRRAQRRIDCQSSGDGVER